MVGGARWFEGDWRASRGGERQKHLDLSAGARFAGALGGSRFSIAATEGALFGQEPFRSCLVMGCQVLPSLELV